MSVGCTMSAGSTVSVGCTMSVVIKCICWIRRKPEKSLGYNTKLSGQLNHHQILKKNCAP